MLNPSTSIEQYGSGNPEQALIELRSDRNWAAGYFLSGLALCGAGLGGAYALITGDHAPIADVLYPFAALSAGVGGAFTAAGGPALYKINREINHISQRHENIS